MTLRAKTPEPTTKRLKLMMHGPAGVGKTTAAVQFKNSYIIDCERGTENYTDLIKASGSVVFQTTDFYEAVQEVKALLTEKHDYRTLVIDPVTTIWNDLLDRHEQKVGADFGRHYQAAAKDMKRLFNLLLQLDMNVILVCHQKSEYGPNMQKIGVTYDAWRNLDYLLDLVVELGRGKDKKQRIAKVVKTRLSEQFPDGDVFPWSFAEIARRFDATTLEREAVAVALATPEQVRQIKDLLTVVRLPEGTTDKWFAKAGVDTWEDMPADVIAKCIEYTKGRLPSMASA